MNRSSLNQVLEDHRPKRGLFLIVGPLGFLVGLVNAMFREGNFWTHIALAFVALPLVLCFGYILLSLLTAYKLIRMLRNKSILALSTEEEIRRANEHVRCWLPFVKNVRYKK